MIDPEIGDYIISSEHIYEITHKFKNGLTTVYKINELDSPAEGVWVDPDGIPHAKIDLTTYTLSHLRHLGEIVKKEEASKAIEVLFQR